MTRYYAERRAEERAEKVGPIWHVIMTDPDDLGSFQAVSEKFLLNESKKGRDFISFYESVHGTEYPATPEMKAFRKKIEKHEPQEMD